MEGFCDIWAQKFYYDGPAFSRAIGTIGSMKMRRRRFGSLI